MLSYRKGVEVAERYLGSKHAICVTLRNSLIAAKKVAAREDMKASTKSAASARRTGGGAKSTGSGAKKQQSQLQQRGRGGGGTSAEDKYEADRLANSMSSELNLKVRSPGK